MYCSFVLVTFLEQSTLGRFFSPIGRQKSILYATPVHRLDKGCQQAEPKKRKPKTTPSVRTQPTYKINHIHWRPSINFLVKIKGEWRNLDLCYEKCIQVFVCLHFSPLAATWVLLNHQSVKEKEWYIVAVICFSINWFLVLNWYAFVKFSPVYPGQTNKIEMLNCSNGFLVT